MSEIKPNVQLEDEIISVLLHHPERTQDVRIDEDWFRVQNYRALFKAINDHPEFNDYLQWIEPAKEYGFKGNFKEVSEISKRFVTQENFGGLVRTLKKEFLENNLMQDLQNTYKNHSTKNFHICVDDLSNLDQMDIDRNDGDLTDVGNEMIDSLYEPRPVGIKVGEYHQLEDVFQGGLYPSLFTIGARPAQGKSAYVINMIVQIMESDPECHISLITLEMSKSECIERIVSCITGVNSFSLKNPYERIHNSSVKEYVRQTIKSIMESNLKIFDKSSDLDTIMNTLKSEASGLNRNKYVAFIDYIGLISVNDNRDRYLQIGEASRALKNFSNNYHAPVIMITQLSRAVESRDDKTPRLSDIALSGAVEQDSNVIGFLSKSDDSNDKVRIVNLKIAKNRAGELKTIKYSFNGKAMKLKEIDANE